MELFWGVLGMVLSVVLFCLLLLSERNPKRTLWNSDFLVGGIFVPLITGLGLIGGLLIIQYMIVYDAATLSAKALYMSAAVAVLGLAALKSMRIKKRLAQYRSLAEASAATVHHLKNIDTFPEPPIVDRHAA